MNDNKEFETVEEHLESLQNEVNNLNSILDLAADAVSMVIQAEFNNIEAIEKNQKAVKKVYRAGFLLAVAVVLAHVIILLHILGN